jgi:Ca-activated chloride channel family protein
MTWAGLDLVTLWTAAAALAVGLTLLHLLRVQRRRVVVGSAALWLSLTEAGRANALLRKLRRLWSLILLLAIGGALLAALGDPQPVTGSVLGFEPAEAPPRRHTMILLDTSASMDTARAGATRLERSAERAHALVDRLASNPEHRLMVAAAGRRLTPLTLWSRGGSAAHEAIDRALVAGPADQTLDPEAVSATVSTILAGLEQADAVLFTDGAFDTEGQEAFAFSADLVGGQSENLSIEAFNVRPALDGSASYAIFTAVRNHQDRPVKATLLLYARGGARAVEDFVSPDRIVSSHAMTIPALAVHREVLTDILFGGDRLAARVVLDPASDAVDGLGRDDVAVALVPPRRALRVQLVGPENLFVSASLLTLENVALEAREAKDFRGPAGYDLTVVNGADVDLSAPGNYLLINPPPSAVIEHRGELRRPRIDRVDGRHPITRDLRIVDASIERATRVAAEAGDRVLVRAKGGAPLVFTRERDGGERRFLVLAFAPEESLLPLRYAFPLLMVKSLGWFMPQAKDLVPTHEVGVALSVSTKLPPGPLRFQGPGDEAARAVRRIGDRIHFVGDRVGVYELSHERSSSRELLALNLMDAGESRLDPRAELRPYAPPDLWRPAEPPWPGTPWRMLLLGACALLIFEWWTWHRRLTA